MNKGEFKNGDYIKYVSFLKSVLWKDRQLSLPPDVVNNLDEKGFTIFIDAEEGERWTFRVIDILSEGEWKVEGQEKQLYFPIDLAEKIEDKEEQLKYMARKGIFG